MRERNMRWGPVVVIEPSGTGLADAGSSAAPDPPAHATAATRLTPAADGSRVSGRARVIIAIRDVVFHQEVLDYLGRDPRLEVIASVSEPARLQPTLHDAPADAVILCPAMSRAAAVASTDARPPTLFVVAEEMTVPVLRGAIDAGAQGAFCWPEERAELLELLPRSRSSERAAAKSRGRVIAVYGARGGAGVTFLATHLAAAFADRGLATALVDMDPAFSDLTAALGVGSQDGVRTIGDLVPVMEELSPEHVEQVLYRHPRGFSALLGPGGSDVAAAPPVPVGLYSASVALLAVSFQVVILQVARTLDAVPRTAVALADEVVLVTGLDVFSLYGARRVMSALELDGRAADRCRVVVNRSRRSEVMPTDVERVVGSKPVAQVRFDPAVLAAQDRGELLNRRSRRAGRDVASLASLLLPAASGNTEA